MVVKTLIEMSPAAASGDAAGSGEKISLLSDLDIYFENYHSEDNFTLLDILGGGQGGLNDASASLNLSIAKARAPNSVFSNGSLIPDYIDDLLDDLDSDLKEGAACRGGVAVSDVIIVNCGTHREMGCKECAIAVFAGQFE